MMQRTRGVNAGMAEYAFQIRDAGPLVNKEATSLIFYFRLIGRAEA